MNNPFGLFIYIIIRILIKGMLNEKRYYKDYVNLLRKYDKLSYFIALNSFKNQFIRIAKDYINNPLTPLGLLIKESDTRELLLQIYYGIGVEMAIKINESFIKRKSSNLVLETKNDIINVQTPENPSINTNYWKNEFTRFTQSKECGIKITQITKTTKEQIRKVIEKSVDKGLSAVATAKEIQKEASSITTKNRALLIARTENTVASNYGALSGAKASGIELYKKWIARGGDSKTRDAHIGMIDSEPIPINDVFEVGGEKMSHPADNKHGASASNICNCRCILAFIPADEVVNKRINKQPLKEPKPKVVDNNQDIVNIDSDDFIEAKTIEQAQDFVIKKGIAKTVDYSYIKDIKVANQINKTLFELKKEYDFNPINIKKMDASTMRKGAMMSANGGNLSINSAQFKNLKNINKLNLSATEGFINSSVRNIDIIKKNIEFTKGSVNQSKWLLELKRQEENLKYSRFTVSYGEERFISDTVVHEFGHVLTDQRTGLQNSTYFLDKKHLEVGSTFRSKEYVTQLNREWITMYKNSLKNGDIYKVSKYASYNHKELFSESFVMYRNNDVTLPKGIRDFIEKYFTLTR